MCPQLCGAGGLGLSSTVLQDRPLPRRPLVTGNHVRSESSDFTDRIHHTIDFIFDMAKMRSHLPIWACRGWRTYLKGPKHDDSLQEKLQLLHLSFLGCPYWPGRDVWFLHHANASSMCAFSRGSSAEPGFDAPMSLSLELHCHKAPSILYFQAAGH